MMRRLAAQALLSIAAAGPLSACPVEKIARATREPLAKYEKIELPARDVRSLEGAGWWIYLRPNKVLHSIVRIDFGETGQTQTRASFVGPHSFGIVVATLRYDAPIEPYRRTEIAERFSTEFFFCGKDDLIYVPTNPQQEASALESIRKARLLKALFFDSEEIAPYLKRLGDPGLGLDDRVDPAQLADPSQPRPWGQTRRV